METFDKGELEPVKDLIEHWLTELTLEAKREVVEDPRFTCVWAWAAHCHHVAVAFIRVVEGEHLWWETAGSLVRLCHELGVKALWMAQSPEAFSSTLWKHQEERRKMHTTYVETIDDLKMESMPPELPPQMVKPEALVVDFRRTCDQFEIGSYMYLIYQILCEYSHASAGLTNEYTDLLSESNKLESYRASPHETEASIKIMLTHVLGQSLVWAQASVLSMIDSPAEMARLRGVADQVKTEVLPALKQVSHAARSRPKRKTRRNRRRG